MQNELRYQAKIRAISKKLAKEKIKISHLLPQFFFFYYEKNNTKTTTTCSKVKNQNLNCACVVRSNMYSQREVQNYQDRKAATRRAFSVILKQYL
jgi:hypothetical protein